MMIRFIVACSSNLSLLSLPIQFLYVSPCDPSLYLETQSINLFIRSVGHGQISSQCVIDCVIGYRNFTHRKQFKRFDLADKQYGVDLRRFIRKTYSEELRAYCK